jgi:hypothetical protein
MRGPSPWVYALVSCVMCACSHGQTSRSFRGNWDDAKARETALSVASSWQFSGDSDFGGVSVAQLERNAYAILPFDKGGTSRRLVLVAVSPPDYTCHACSPVTGGVIFIGKDGGWEVGYDQKKIVSLGASGQPPKARLQQLGPAIPAVAFEMDSMAQGYAATSLTLVSEVEGKLKAVLSLETAESNEAAGLPENQTFQWHATLEFIPSSNGKYPDIRVKSTGTKQTGEGKPLQPYSSTVTYRFSDGTYRPS